jgi:hypothetical protein
MPIKRQQVAKHILAEAKARNNRTSIARQRRGKRAFRQYRLFSVVSVQNSYNRVEFRTWQLQEYRIVERIRVESSELAAAGNDKKGIRLRQEDFKFR